MVIYCIVHMCKAFWPGGVSSCSTIIEVAGKYVLVPLPVAFPARDISSVPRLIIILTGIVSRDEKIFWRV